MSNYYISITSNLVGNGWTNLQTTEDAISRETHGVVVTQRGFVRVTSYVFRSGKYSDTTSFEIILDSRIYYGRIKKSYSKRYLATIAHRFADECYSLSKEEKIKGREN